MKFRAIKRYAEESNESLLAWIKMELNSVLRELFIGLGNLTFKDNFTSFEWVGSISANTQVQVTHNLGIVPSRYIITDAVGTRSIVRVGDASIDIITFKNIDTVNAFTGKILILL